MEQVTFEDAILKAVKWWSEKSFQVSLNQNNGDNSKHGDMAFMLMNMVAMNAQKTVTADKINKFETHLSKSLMEYRKNNPTSSIWLDVDYHPCQMLVEAAQHAQIDESCFPCKSSTTIGRDNIVTAKYQYGGSPIKL